MVTVTTEARRYILAATGPGRFLIESSYSPWGFQVTASPTSPLAGPAYNFEADETFTIDLSSGDYLHLVTHYATTSLVTALPPTDTETGINPDQFGGRDAVALAAAWTYYTTLTETTGPAISNPADPSAKFDLPPNTYGTTGTPIVLKATGLGQAIIGGGATTRLNQVGLEVDDDDRTLFANLLLSGVSPFGIRWTGGNLLDGQSARQNIINNVWISDKTIGLKIDPALSSLNGSVGVVHNQISNLTLLGNDKNAYIGDAGSLDIVNLQSIGASGVTAGPSVLIEGGQEIKMLNSRFRPASSTGGLGTGGAAFAIKGITGLSSLESYFGFNNFNQGSTTDHVAITSIVTHDAGARIKATLASPHKVAVGYKDFIIQGSPVTGYNKTWDVYAVTALNEVVLDDGSGAAFISNSTGTFARYFPGMHLDGELHLGSGADVSGARINDLSFVSGSSNDTQMTGVYNANLFARAWGGKNRTRITGCNRITFWGSGRGRAETTPADVIPYGSYQGWGLIGNHDASNVFGYTDPGSMWGIKVPWHALGFRAGTEEVAGFVEIMAERNNIHLSIGDAALRLGRETTTGPIIIDAGGGIIRKSSSVIKAWAVVDTTTSPISLLAASPNVLSLTDLSGESTGRYRIITKGDVANSDAEVTAIANAHTISRKANAIQSRFIKNRVDVDTSASGASTGSTAVSSVWITGIGGTM